MTAKVILNPYAGRWRAKEQMANAEAALHNAGVDYVLEVTQGPGHGEEIAARAMEEGFSPIIAAGGDGSINEVVNGMVRASITKHDKVSVPLGIIPFGSANDLVVNLGLPVELKAAVDVIARGKQKTIDLGQVTFGKEQKVRYFGNNSAIGLEPTVTLIQEQITKVRGIVRYLIATLIGVMRNPSWIISLEWENGEYQGPATLVTVGNNPLTGGIFYMTPHANPYDGLLTFTYGYLPSRFQILKVLPKTMKPAEGNYVEHPAIREYNSAWLRIQTDPATPLHTDGEIQSKAVSEFEYRIHPEYLPVLSS